MTMVSSTPLWQLLFALQGGVETEDNFYNARNKKLGNKGFMHKAKY